MSTATITRTDPLAEAKIAAEAQTWQTYRELLHKCKPKIAQPNDKTPADVLTREALARLDAADRAKLLDVAPTLDITGKMLAVHLMALASVVCHEATIAAADGADDRFHEIEVESARQNQAHAEVVKAHNEAMRLLYQEQSTCRTRTEVASNAEDKLQRLRQIMPDLFGLPADERNPNAVHWEKTYNAGVDRLREEADRAEAASRRRN